MRYSSVLLAALIACTVAAQDTTSTMATKTKAVKNTDSSSGVGVTATGAKTVMSSIVPGTAGASGNKGSSTSMTTKSKVAQKSGGNSTATNMAVSTSGGISTGTGAVIPTTGSGTTSSRPAVQTTNAGEILLASSGGAIVITALSVVFAVYM